MSEKFFQVYDGWRVFDWLKKKHYSLPDDEFDSEKSERSTRERDLCNDRALWRESQISMQTSQNAGQIFYRFARGDSVIVNIEFIEDEQCKFRTFPKVLAFFRSLRSDLRLGIKTFFRSVQRIHQR